MGDLERLFNTPVGSGDQNSYMPEYVSYGGRTYDRQDNGYLAYDWDSNNNFSRAGSESQFNGENYDQYDLNGLFTNSGQFSGINDSNKAMDFVQGAAMMLPGVAAGVSPTVNTALSFGTNPVMSGLSNTGAITSATQGLTGLPGVVSGATGGPNFSQGFTDGGTAGGALDTTYASGTMGTNGGIAPVTEGGTTGPNFTQGYTDGGTAGGAADTNYASTTPGTNGGIAPGGTTGVPPVSTTPTTPTTVPTPTTQTGSGFGLKDILGLAGGLWDMNNQKNASADMLSYLKERQGINDNMYAPGSSEYNALWDEMSRKDAAAGRNSQYGPRSVDLAARIAQLKMDANTRMTTGIGSLYKDSLDQGAGSNAGILSALGALGQNNSSMDLSGIGDWITNLFHS
jgi:hypothetical protein